MAKTTTAPFTQTIRTLSYALTNASSFTATQPGTAPTNVFELLAAGDEGSIVKQLTAVTDATAAAQTVGLWISTDAGTTKHLIGVINVPLNSGYTGAIVSVDFLSNSIISGLSYDQMGKPVLCLQASAKLYVGCLTTAVASNKTLWITSVVEDF